MSGWRITFVFFLIVAAGLGIAGRLFYVQIHQGGYYEALARGQHTTYIISDPPRGDIFFQDKFFTSPASVQNGLYLAATNKDWPLLYAIPKEIEDARFVASQIAPLLGVEEEDIYEKLKDPQDPYEPLAHRLEQAKADEITTLGLGGIYTQKERLRHYPANDLAGKILGFVGYRAEGRVGQYGLEGFYDDVLRGKEGTLEIPLLSSGNRNGGGFVQKGDDLISSIDYNIQFTLEKKLAEAKEALEADGASVVVIDPRTGELIALASTDSFDPNAYSQVENIDLFLNGATQRIFEPGSIFKPFTMAAGIDAGLISPQTEYTDTGAVTIGKYTIRNSTGEKYGVQTMTNVLELSLNTGAVFVQKLIGQNAFREYVDRFGFGKRTGVDLQGEVAGDIQNILYTSREINFATASFGQGIAVTPMQLVASFSAFANGGQAMKPRVVREIRRGDGTRKILEPEVLANPISAKTAAQITSMLVNVVDNGYGEKAAVKGYKVAGKTGTAQVPKRDGKGYEEDKTIHSFIGYAPAYDPKFLALVKVDNPRGINFSADSVAPLFSQIAEYILNYYEIPPDN